LAQVEVPLQLVASTCQTGRAAVCCAPRPLLAAEARLREHSHGAEPE